jgi:hypothetical protein
MWLESLLELDSHPAAPGYTYTVKGIVPGANLISVLDANGSGTDSAVISTIQTAISLQSSYNIGIINLSLGSQRFESYTLDPLCQALGTGVECRNRSSCCCRQSGTQQQRRHKRLGHHSSASE